MHLHLVFAPMIRRLPFEDDGVRVVESFERMHEHPHGDWMPVLGGVVIESYEQIDHIVRQQAFSGSVNDLIGDRVWPQHLVDVFDALALAHIALEHMDS